MARGSILNDLCSLHHEVAVVTGALGRLGSIWISTLLDHGASVLALDRPSVKISDEFKKLLGYFDQSRLKLLSADVRDRKTLETVCQQCVSTMGVPSILVNNAGIDRPPSQEGKGYRIENIPYEENREILEVNTLGMFLVTQVFGEEMVKARKGSVINIGSLYSGVAPDPKFYDHIPGDPPFLKPPAYGASKAAVVNLTRYLATLWAPYGIRVNALSPGGVLGDQDKEFREKFCNRVPMGRMAVESDLRGPLIFLASAASSYVTGIELKVDGGFTAW
jgi:NAD(P)-dependent dehydrogenase (short-subunit alcohol dehydrogenase family)